MDKQRNAARARDATFKKDLFSDEALFATITEPHVATLLHAARNAIECAKRLGNNIPDALEPEELVGETLIHAWEARHSRPQYSSLKDWLLEVQKHTLQTLIAEERQLRETLAVSLEGTPSLKQLSNDDSGYWEWAQPVANPWEDVVPYANARSIAA